ncbi:glycosyltransferase family 1 protein [Lawsonia intracellularis]|uniref:glycosyltransferase n=1 Tax=Lawsonia intracellularis TaxID=29546 RepID=UPI000976F630|nr:glycosyltransferase [Lawsonia intracellularis]OMQ04697.1 glycosyltransferase [Lawsonia intracellularis]RBN33584.1 glycosyltransferase family 1 protein [Lawsonia intracellularis]RBN34185.1 glycosyltransferase family 1 protein [Lawsonia intracellularis]UYH53448.1 glycosyltransferase [Lawsonia intracellularis]
MHVIFINYGGYLGCSGVHIHFLAQTLTQQGIRCTVYLPVTIKSKNYFGQADYPIFTHNDLVAHSHTGYFKDSIIHAWTPREVSRKLTIYVVAQTHVPYFVHLEDNEITIMEQMFNKPFIQLQQEALEKPALFKDVQYCHPLYFQQFLNNATGVTCIINKLEEHVPSHVPRMTFWPACEETFFRLPEKIPESVYKELGFPLNTIFVVYPGNIHEYNKKHVSNLITAIDYVNKKGHSIKLLRCGETAIPMEQLAPPHALAHIIDLGTPEAHKLHNYISLAHILVQPGCPGDFDDYRFPSKIPLFLASGRPVILPNTNIGLNMTHGKNCLLLKTGSAEEITKYLCLLIENPKIATSIGKQGKQFAYSTFSWEKSAKKLIQFYKKCLPNL